MKQDWASSLEAGGTFWISGTSWLIVIWQLNSPVFTETRTLNLQRTPSLRFAQYHALRSAGFQLEGSAWHERSRHYGSSAWGLSPGLIMRPRDGVGSQNRRPFIFQRVFYILGRRHIEPWSHLLCSPGASPHCYHILDRAIFMWRCWNQPRPQAPS